MKQFFFSILALITSAFLAWYFAPQIFSDLRADKSTLVQSQNYRVLDASCRTTLGVVSTCNIDVENQRSGGEMSFNYALFSNLDGETVFVMENAKTGYATTNIGVEHLINRVLTLIGALAFLAFVGIKGLQRSFSSRSSHGGLQYR